MKELTKDNIYEELSKTTWNKLKDYPIGLTMLYTKVNNTSLKDFIVTELPDTNITGKKLQHELEVLLSKYPTYDVNIILHEFFVKEATPSLKQKYSEFLWYMYSLIK